MANELILDPIAHKYTLDGKYIPGVSGILKRVGLIDFSGVPVDVLEAARAFGSAVHKACELEDLGTLDMESLSEPLLPYLEAWRKFKEDTGAEIVENEKSVYSAKWFYAGTIDRIAIIKGKRVLIDIKSSSMIYPSMKIQLAGYEVAYKEMTGEKIKQRLVVQLLKDGSYKPTVFNDDSDIQVFLAAVQISKWKIKEKKYYE